MRARDRVAAPEFPIPDLSERQQEEAGLPADFWDAFDTFFARIAEAHLTDLVETEVEARTAVVDTLGLGEGFTTGRDEAGWGVESIDEDSITLEYTAIANDSDYGDTEISGGSLILRPGPGFDAVQAMLAATEDRVRRELFTQIVSDEEALWSFLPGTYRQRTRAENVRNNTRFIDVKRRVRDLRYGGDAEALAEARSELAEEEANVEYYRRSRGWPTGDMSPQKSSDGKWYDYDPSSNVFFEVGSL